MARKVSRRKLRKISRRRRISKAKRSRFGAPNKGMNALDLEENVQEFIRYRGTGERKGKKIGNLTLDHYIIKEILKAMFNTVNKKQGNFNRRYMEVKHPDVLADILELMTSDKNFI